MTAATAAHAVEKSTRWVCDVFTGSAAALIADGGLNFVAACVPCNLEKSDRTAIELVTHGGRAK